VFFAWEGDGSGKPLEFATYKPGDRPESKFGTAEGCLRKRQRIFTVSYRHLVLRCNLQHTMRGRRRGHHEQPANLFVIPQPFFFGTVTC